MFKLGNNKSDDSVVNETPSSISSSVSSNDNSSSASNIRLENKKIIKDLEHRLRGETFDSETGMWMDGTDLGIKRIVNTEEGINIFLSFLEPLTNKAITLSDMTEKMISSYMVRYCKSVILTIAKRAQIDFDCDIARMELMKTLLIALVGASFMRSLNAGERASLAEAVREIQSFIYGKKKESNNMSFQPLLGR